jgi:hypothetical protein
MYRQMRKKRDYDVVSVTIILTIALNWAQSAHAVVLDFDDLPQNHQVTSTAYGGLVWETGNPGVGGANGYWSTTDFGYPHSPPRNVVNAGGSTLLGIRFPSASDVTGAYVAVQGNVSIAWTSGLRVHGYNSGQEVATTDWFTTISTTPAWFDMTALTNVDQIVFESVPVYENTGYYGLDDLTFTYVPEPAGISLGLLALGGLFLRRERR